MLLLFTPHNTLYPSIQKPRSGQLDQSSDRSEDWSGPVLCGPVLLSVSQGLGPGPGTGPKFLQSWSGPTESGPGLFTGPRPVLGPDPATLHSTPPGFACSFPWRRPSVSASPIVPLFLSSFLSLSLSLGFYFQSLVLLFYLLI